MFFESPSTSRCSPSSEGPVSPGSGREEPSQSSKVCVLLIQRIAQGDREAFAEFYDLTIRRLYAISVRILQNGADADDVVQETFVAVWNLAPQFDVSRGGPLAWTGTICRHKSIDLWRARNRHTDLIAANSSTVDALYMREVTGSRGGPENAMYVRSAVTALKGSDREVVELAFFHGRSHQEIAKERREPLGTVKARIRRALCKLRASLITVHAEAC